MLRTQNFFYFLLNFTSMNQSGELYFILFLVINTYKECLITFLLFRIWCMKHSTELFTISICEEWYILSFNDLL